MNEKNARNTISNDNNDDRVSIEEFIEEVDNDDGTSLVKFVLRSSFGIFRLNFDANQLTSSQRLRLTIKQERYCEGLSFSSTSCNCDLLHGSDNVQIISINNDLQIQFPQRTLELLQRFSFVRFSFLFLKIIIILCVYSKGIGTLQFVNQYR